MRSYRSIDQIAREQLGLITRHQLYELRQTRGQIERLVARRELIPVRLGVYRLCGVQSSWHVMAMAAVLAGGDGCVLSHRSAAFLWGMIGREAEAGPLELTAQRRCRIDGAVAHRSIVLPAEHARREGIPVTTAARTVLDLGASLDAAALGAVVDESLRRRLFSLSQLQAVVALHRGGGRLKLAPIDAVLGDRVRGYDPGANDWEQKMDRLWDRLGLPPARRQYRIRLRQKQYIVDRAIVDLKVAVEWNGYTPHGLRTNFDRDSDRRAELAAAGWHVLDFTSKSSPELICRAVLAVVEQRRSRTA